MHFKRTLANTLLNHAIPMIHKESSITQSSVTFLILRRTKANTSLTKHCDSNSVLKLPQLGQSYTHTQASKIFSCYKAACVITLEANKKSLHHTPVIQGKERMVVIGRLQLDA